MPSTKTLRRQQKARHDAAAVTGNTNPTTTTPPPHAAASKNPLPRKLKAMPPLKRAKMERLKNMLLPPSLKLHKTEQGPLPCQSFVGGFPLMMFQSPRPIIERSPPRRNQALGFKDLLDLILVDL